MSVRDASPAPDTLELHLILPREAQTRRRMRAVARLRNVAGRPLDLYLRGRGVTLDVIAKRNDGETVWRRLDGEVIPAIIQHVRLAPGEALEVPISWRWALEEGDYRLQALLLTEDEPVASRDVSLRLRP